MKLILSILFILSISFNTFAQLSSVPKQDIPAEYGFIVKQGQQIPEFQFVLSDGRTIKTSDLKGKVVMLQFTASWCVVCRKEMPHIEKEIWLKHKDNPDFELFGVDFDETLKKVKKFEKNMNITYPMALDPGGEIFYTFAAKGAGVTRNVIIGKDGKIAYVTRLFKKDEFDEMVGVIEFLLKS